EENHKKLFEWLSAPDHHSKHTNACNERHEETGLWFLQGQDFQEWKSKDNSFLWLHGIPGAGKSVLCSTIIEDISRHCKSDPTLALAYFYFDFHTSDTRPDAALRAIIKQLSLQCAAIPVALVKLFNESKRSHQSPTLGQLMATLKAILGGFQGVYIVFDALDECPQRGQLLKLLREFNVWGLGTSHLLATSRKERDIEDALDSLVSHQVPMDESLVDIDIRLHVTQTLEHDTKFSRCSTEEKRTIENTLIEGARGM
ncbi:hypothetical protein JB92DRAFT_2727720, partial [Gautieria morchelliformis]